ncbi:Hypothetical protein PHPALM_12056 [Phytophthora palmivora]|uniref:Uncharacterized protein n=1 Tax=Phytophthora palmivora TaxID=4796 RepID=A0A2P4Y0Q9_9STRA|nr:Hypothetical protein PHPALM_12056 [Phytophthora palmivora]
MAPLRASQLPPETLHACDVLTYYLMAFVCGNPRGYKEAVVLSIKGTDDEEHPVSVNTGEIIKLTMMDKRIKEWFGNLVGDGEGHWRKVRTLTLVPGLFNAPQRSSKFCKLL